MNVTQSKKPYKIGTRIPGLGVIQAVKSGNPRNYLFIHGAGVGWVDELAIDAIFKTNTEMRSND